MRDIKSRQVDKSVTVNQARGQQEQIIDTAVDISGHKFSSVYNDSTPTGVGHLGAQALKKEEAKKTKSKTKKAISSRRKISGAVFLFGLMMALFVFTDLTSIDIFFWLFFVAMFWYRLDSRISIGGALIGLIIIMLLSAGQGFGWWKADDLMEQIAVGVYFFLVIGVVKQIWEYREESKIESP